MLDVFKLDWIDFKFPNDDVAQGVHMQFGNDFMVAVPMIVPIKPDIFNHFIILAWHDDNFDLHYCLPHSKEIPLLEGLVEKWQRYIVSREFDPNAFRVHPALILGDQQMFKKIMDELGPLPLR